MWRSLVVQGGKPPEEEEQKWGLLDLEAYQKPWDVPWGAKTVVGGMTLWATSFIIVGIVLLPLIGYTFGIEVSRNLPYWSNNLLVSCRSNPDQ